MKIATINGRTVWVADDYATEEPEKAEETKAEPKAKAETANKARKTPANKAKKEGRVK